VSRAAIDQAIGMNGVAVAMNQAAFQLGRLTAHAPDDALLATGQAAEATTMDPPRSLSLDVRIEARSDELEAYQDGGLAQRYRSAVQAMERTEAGVDTDSHRLTKAVAEGLFRVLAAKDEHEVARLYADGRFRRKLEASFEDGRLRVHLAPPLLGFLKDATGRPRNVGFGPWVLVQFGLLARCKRCRACRHRYRGILSRGKCSMASVLGGVVLPVAFESSAAWRKGADTFTTADR